MTQKKQKGVTLLETILVLVIISIIAVGIIRLIQRQTNNIRNLITAEKMSLLLNAAENYTYQNFGDIQDNIATNSFDVRLDNGKIVVVASQLININTLKNQNFLPGSFDNITPWGSRLSVGVAQIGQSDVLQVIVVNINNSVNGKELAPLLEQQSIAANIEKNAGGIWFVNEDILDACTSSTNCINGVNGNWEMSNPGEVFLPMGANEIPVVSSAVAVSIIDGSKKEQDPLYRHPIKNHIEENSISTDLRLKNSESEAHDFTRSIFFNALRNEDLDGDGYVDFSGPSLTYNQTSLNGNVNDRSRAVLSASDNSGTSAPFFSSTGGVATLREENVGSACNLNLVNLNDKSSDFGVIVIDSISKRMLKCVLDNNSGLSFWKEVDDVDIITPDSQLGTIYVGPLDAIDHQPFNYVEGATIVLLEAVLTYDHLENGKEQYLKVEDKLSGQMFDVINFVPTSDKSTPTTVHGYGLFPIKEGEVIIETNSLKGQTVNGQFRFTGYVNNN